MRDVLWTKTEAGRTEITSRALKLSPAMRMVLLLVDGRRTGDELARMAVDLHAPADTLDSLARLHLIEPLGGIDSQGVAAIAPTGSTTAERFRLLYGLMSESVNQHLGLRGYFMQLKIERCADADALAALLPTLSDAIAKARGESVRTQWERGIREALAHG